MNKEDLDRRVENAMKLEELLALPEGYHMAENVFGNRMAIFRRPVGEGYSLIFPTSRDDELYIEDFDEEGHMYNFDYVKESDV